MNEFLQAAGILEEFNNLITNAHLTNIVLVERPQYLKLTNIFVQSFNIVNDKYHPSVEFMLYEQPWRMALSDFCSALGVPNTGLTSKMNAQPHYSVMTTGGSPRVLNLGAFSFPL